MVLWYHIVIVTGSRALALWRKARAGQDRAGLIPVAFGCRKMNCVGVLLAPITLNMAGVGANVAHWLGLI